MIKSLHGLRGVMAFLVIFHHFSPHLFVDKISPGNLHHAVDVFFCLSGYVLTLVYRDLLPFSRVSFIEFTKNRIARIVPLAYLSTFIFFTLHYLIFILAIPINNPVDIGWKNLIANLLFLDTNLPWFTSYGAKWSVSNEMAVYFLLFPFTFILGKVREIFSLLFLVIIILVQIYYYDLLSSFGYLFSRCIPNFLIGCLLFNITIPKTNTVSTLLGCMGFIMFFIADDSLSGVFSCLIIIFCLSSSRMVSLLFTNKPALLLGDISYSLYLLHGAVYLLVAGLLKKDILMSTYQYWITVPLGFTLILSYLSWRWFEIPARNYIRKVL